MLDGSRHRTTRDGGAVLPIVLVVSVILAMVVVGVAQYGTANLRYSHVTERRSDQLAAADAAMSYAVNLIKIGAADCIFNDQTIDLPQLVETFNGATGSVQCSQTGGGLDSAGLFAMVLTGQGVPSSAYLVETSGGSVKEFGGPLFMERVDAAAFDLANNKGLLIKNAPLLHYDGTTPQCQAISETVLDPDVDFDPDAIFGPICTGDHWYDYGPGGATFDEPSISVSFDPQWIDAVATTSGGAMPVYDGSQPASYTAVMPLTDDPADADKIVTVQGGYTDVPDASTGGICRVFEPGRYVRPPNVLNSKVYFKSGEYLFDFRAPATTPSSFQSWGYAGITDAEFELDKTTVTAGRLDPGAGIAAAVPNPTCQAQMDADTGGYGVTFYMSGKAHIGLDTQAIIEIMPRDQGTATDPLYVGIHALCDRASGADSTWCVNSPAFSSPTLAPPPSDRQAPSSSSNPALVWIKAGNVSEVVSNGLIYAPRAELEFRNVTNDAEVRLRGGAVVARATVDASASAENFEIGVGSQNVDLDLYLVATGTDTEGGSTKIGSDVDLDYDEPDVNARLDVLSWRVCETVGC